MYRVNVGVPLHVVKVDMISFADDIAGITGSEENLQGILSEMHIEMKEELNTNMKNRQKMKILVCTKDSKNKTAVKLRNEGIQEAEEFK